MIIFDLDGTLADCEHRRHFVDPSKRDDCYYHYLSDLRQMAGWYYNNTTTKFKPNWKSFLEACDQDKPVEPTIRVCLSLMFDMTFQVWSGRCESVREKTIAWLNKHVMDSDSRYRPFDWDSRLKMRPIGDNTPDDELKERWLDEHYSSSQGCCPLRWATHDKCCKKIDMVFDDRPKVVRMWRRRGIFVFNCAQHDGEF